jgi:hypothetical protein
MQTKNKENISIKDFSKHLFWDVNPDTLDLEKHKQYIIHRVLQYGLYHDWILIKNFYGLKEIGEMSIKIRDLDKKTANFISYICQIPKEKFQCYTINQLVPKFWDF